ncbi:MAG TPA: tetratricopeptide repeat protein [Patescibacteria group bacterium]|nr:tetratricopeptide repeat protein [Patescibacteria group bacterium]
MPKISDVDKMFRQATVFLQQKNYQTALPLLRQIAQPDWPEALNNLGVALRETSNLAEARQCFEQILLLCPNDPQANFNLSLTFFQTGNYVQATHYCQQVLSVLPDCVSAHNNLGVIFKETGNFSAAENCFRHCLQLRPEYPEALNNLGVVCEEQGNYLAALEYCSHAVKLLPNYVNAHENCARLLLRSGQYRAGFAAYEWRRQAPEMQALFHWCAPKPAWDGSPFPGRRLLIHDEQGLGDSLQFVRYLPEVKKLGGQVLLTTKAPLLRLYSHLSGVDHLLEQRPNCLPLAEFDLYAPLMSLPHLLAADPSTPPVFPYLTPDPALVTGWGRRLAADQSCRIGLVWSGNTANTAGRERSCPAELLPMLTKRHYSRPVSWYRLQPNAGETVADTAGLINYSAHWQDFADTAALISHLDLVISVDTAVAHLTGALHRPLWILLPRIPDWRWREDDSASLWYPSARLFRQHTRNDWSELLQRAAAALDELLAIPDQPHTERMSVLSIDQHSKTSPKTLPANHLANGRQELEAGNLPQAAAAFSSFLQQSTDPTARAQALQGLAVTATRAGRPDQGLDYFRQAIALQPDYVEAHFNLATLLIKRNNDGDLAEAEAALRRTLALQANHPDALGNLGHVLEIQNKYDEARTFFAQAVELRPDSPLLQYNLGCSLQRQGETDQAISCFRQAIELQPDYIEALCNLGNLEIEQNQSEQAIARFHYILSLNPDYMPAHLNMGNIYKARQDLKTAEQHYRRAADLAPDHPGIWQNLGNIFRERDQIPEAEDAYRRAIKLDPEFVAAYTNLGFVLLEQGRPQEALAAYNRSLELKPDPDVYGNRSQALLMAGNLAEGFVEYEWRTKTALHAPIYNWCKHVPPWQGEIFSGRRLLVYTEQGFGDYLQFIRYLPQIKERGGIVILAAHKAMLRLSAGLSGADYVVEHAEDTYRRLQFDLVLPLLSLPAIFGTTLNTIPAKPAYLHSNPRLAKQWRDRMAAAGATGRQFKIGLVWAGNPKNTMGLKRTCGFAPITALAELPNTLFFSLQLGPAAQEAQNRPSQMQLVDLTADIHDFADTAAIIANLDLVISIDTGVAHLAAALGKPVWLSLPLAQEWRWLLHRSDSPWYPTVRLFRQTDRGDWSGVFQSMYSALLPVCRGREPLTGVPAHG